MTSMNIYRNLGGIDPELIARAAPDEVSRRKKTKAWIKWASLAAACLALAVCIVPLWDALFGGSHGDAPVSNSFESLEDVHEVLHCTCGHRLILNTKAKAAGFDASQVLEQIFASVPIPKLSLS